MMGESVYDVFSARVYRTTKSGCGIVELDGEVVLNEEAEVAVGITNLAIRLVLLVNIGCRRCRQDEYP